MASVASTDPNLSHSHAAMKRLETSATPQHTLTLFHVHSVLLLLLLNVVGFMHVLSAPSLFCCAQKGTAQAPRS